MLKVVPLRLAAPPQSTSPASGRGEESTFLARLRERWHAKRDGEGTSC
jgi:hypothetical protein